MAHQVKVILSALEGSLSPAERTFFLDPTRPMIPVGRASKSVSKGLRGAVDNAWFDSPVMSRDHAEISFNADTKTLLIQDIGSMHGTILNGVQIPGNEYKEVGEGDKLTFGAEVRRGQESFSACAFRVNYEFQPYKSSNTFAFPDSSDVEDEEDYPFSEEEFLMEHLSSEESLSLGSPLPKAPASQAVDAIDLTRDDSPVKPAFDGIDLTGDTPVAGAIEEPAAPEPQDIVNLEEANEPELSLDAAQNQFDDDDSEDGDFSSDSDSDSELQFTKEGPASDDEFDLEEIEDSVNDDSDSIVEDGGDIFQVSNNAVQDATATENYPALTDFMCNKTSINSAQNLVHDAVDTEDIELSKAGAEGIRAMINGSLLHNDSSPTYHYNHFQTLFGNEPSTSTDAEDRPFVLPSTGYPDTSSSALQLQLPSLIQGLREPSPSDAAMAKPTDPNCFPTLHVQQNNAQVLGEKSGKQEFFKAREHNKAILQGKEAEIKAAPFNTFAPDRQHTEAPQAAFPLLNRPIKACVGKLSKIGTLKTVVVEGSSTDFTSSFNPQSPSNYAPPALHSLLDFPDQETSRYRAPSPSFDMTSAVKYNESKASMKKPDKTASNICNTRSGLRIDDIIDTALVKEDHLCAKRKSNEISDNVEEEVRVWGSIDKPDNKTTATASASIPHSHTESSNVQTGVSQDQQQRPTKRLKKIMENVAYIALGGVTVGAALFGGLVATAPDFI